MLLAHLLDECFALTKYEADLLYLLCHQSHAQSMRPTKSTDGLQATIQAQQMTIHKLHEWITTLEETYCLQAKGTKRGHDDQGRIDKD